MKRIFIMSCAVLLVTACNGKSPQQETPAPAQTAPEAAAPDAADKVEAREETPKEETKDAPQTTEDRMDDNVNKKPLADKSVVGEEEVTIPDVAIVIDFDDAAADKLRSLNETIIVAAYFEVHTDDNMPDSYIPILDVGSSGNITVASRNIELTPDTPRAEFRDIRYSRKIYDVLTEADRDLHLLINVFSGRKAIQDNILECEILEKQAHDFGGREFHLKCTLR